MGAALSLGFIHFYGHGVSVDKQKALKYFKFSADKGNARAQYMLHYFYLLDKNSRTMNLEDIILRNRRNKEMFLHKSFWQGVILEGHSISLRTMRNLFTGCKKRLTKMMLKHKEYLGKLTFY